MKKLTSEEILEKYFSEKMLVMETEPENYDGIELQLSYPIPLRWIDEVKAETGVDIVEFAPDEVVVYKVGEYSVGEYSEFYLGAKTSRPEANPVHFGEDVDRITAAFLEDMPENVFAKLSELSIADYGVPPQYVTEELTKALNEVYFSKPEIIEIPGLEELLLNLKGASPIKRSLLKDLIISQVKNA